MLYTIWGLHVDLLGYGWLITTPAKEVYSISVIKSKKNWWTIPFDLHHLHFTIENPTQDNQVLASSLPFYSVSFIKSKKNGWTFPFDLYHLRFTIGNPTFFLKDSMSFPKWLPRYFFIYPYQLRFLDHQSLPVFRNLVTYA